MGFGVLASMGRESQVRKQSRNLAWMLGTAQGPRAEGRVWGGRGWGGGLPTLAWSPGWIPGGPKPRTCGLSAASRWRSAQGCEMLAWLSWWRPGLLSSCPRPALPSQGPASAAGVSAMAVARWCPGSAQLGAPWTSQWGVGSLKPQQEL